MGSDFLLLQLVLINGPTKAALFYSLDLNGFWPGLQNLIHRQGRHIARVYEVTTDAFMCLAV
jgi:hypothetical protein